MYLIGEKLNSSIPSAASLMRNGADDEIAALMKRQLDGGADAIDINTASAGDETALMLRLCSLAADVLDDYDDKTVAVDSSNPAVINTAVRYLYGRGRAALVNSVTAAARLDECAAAIAEYGSSVVVLPIAERLPPTPETAVENAAAAAARLAKYSVDAGKIYADILVETVAADHTATSRALANLAALKSAGFKTVAGVSNAGFGMPRRPLINAAFICAAVAAGLDAAILDVTSETVMDAVAASELIAGHDEFGMEYIGYIRGKGR